MWLFTVYGFFSVVCDNVDVNMLHVQTDYKKQLENLRARFPSLKGYRIHETDSEYRFRMMVERDKVTGILHTLVKEIGYHNFKPTDKNEHE